MYPDDENERSFTGQFVDPNLNGVYANAVEQQIAGVNVWDSKETAAQKVMESRTIPIVEVKLPVFEPSINSAPTLPTPTPAPSFPISSGESTGYRSSERPKVGSSGNQVHVGDIKSPAKNPARAEKIESSTTKITLGARVTKAFSLVLKMAVMCVVVLIVSIIYSSDWAKSISKKWENEAAVNVFGSEQLAPMSAYKSLMEKLGKAPTFEVKKLVAFAASRNRPGSKRGTPEYLTYAAASWNCISQDPKCVREINRAGPNAVSEIRSLAFDWLIYANESGNRDAAADLGLYSLKGAWGTPNAGIQSAVSFWRSGKLNNDGEDRLSRLMQTYASSTDLSVLRWVRETQGNISTTLSNWMR